VWGQDEGRQDKQAEQNVTGRPEEKDLDC